jgi:hypothetical protein
MRTSRRVAKALRLCEYDVTHVELEGELGKGTPDEVIVPWCGDNRRVWVTIDHDPRARHIRFALVPQHKVHAIILDPEPVGIRAQLGRIVRFYPDWVRTLGHHPDGSHKVWRQRKKGRLDPLFKS